MRPDWPAAEIAALLGSGHASGGSASGPMAEVVLAGTQYLSDADLADMAVYLKALPGALAKPGAAPAAPTAAPTSLATLGQKVYEQHCADCHGVQGQGLAGAFPPLAGNRAVTMAHTENLLQAVLFGGYGAATPGHPRPYGMPPFTLTLNDTQVAAVLTYIRTSWGQHAGEVSALDVLTMRQAMSAGAAR